ncbi:hypothetical protein GCM10025868_03070 [Angustibacter aerolatus]|uniref:FAD/NAD(P)-binding domain-containing protein n=1 Tax=Angustibacter aerolatus TaxID=1162965 RepID=A0ABQ6JB87_9ACTN|nr:hypothetical protein GCM10025868_03070 [Angustibacter aerolatus]
MPRPPEERPGHQPWPTYPMTYRVASAHEEGGDRQYAVNTQALVDDGTGRVGALRLVEVEPAQRSVRAGRGVRARDPRAGWCCWPWASPVPSATAWWPRRASRLDERGNVRRDGDFATTQRGVYVAGDAGRGQSLIVWAIAEGRSCAAAVDRFLSGATRLPSPIRPTDRPLTA